MPAMRRVVLCHLGVALALGCNSESQAPPGPARCGRGHRCPRHLGREDDGRRGGVPDGRPHGRRWGRARWARRRCGCGERCWRRGQRHRRGRRLAGGHRLQRPRSFRHHPGHEHRAWRWLRRVPPDDAGSRSTASDHQLGQRHPVRHPGLPEAARALGLARLCGDRRPHQQHRRRRHPQGGHRLAARRERPRGQRLPGRAGREEDWRRRPLAGGRRDHRRRQRTNRGPPASSPPCR